MDKTLQFSNHNNTHYYVKSMMENTLISALHICETFVNVVFFFLITTRIKHFRAAKLEELASVCINLFVEINIYLFFSIFV